VFYSISYTNQFYKDFSLIRKRNLNIDKFKSVIKILQSGSLINTNNNRNIKHCGELHIEPDWLLVYKYDIEKHILYLIRTGSHSDLY